jgi:intein-encoded DNA endonuclease-like protein
MNERKPLSLEEPFRTMIVKVLKEEIAKAIEDEFKRQFRDNDGKFYIKTPEDREAYANKIIDYLMEKLAEKMNLLCEAKL